MANHPSSAPSKAHQKSGPFAPPALPGLDAPTTLSGSRPACRLARHSQSRPAAKTGLPRSPATPSPTCCAHYPGGSGRVRLSVASPSHAAFPVSQAGRHPHLHFRGLLRLHALRPVGSLNRPRRPLSQGFDPPGCPDKPPASYQFNRQLTGWILLHWCHTRSGRTEISGLTTPRPPAIATTCTELRAYASPDARDCRAHLRGWRAPITMECSGA